MPSRSKPRSVFVRTFCEIPSTDLRNWANRSVPSERRRIISTVHLSAMRSSTCRVGQWLSKTFQGGMVSKRLVSLMKVPTCEYIPGGGTLPWGNCVQIRKPSSLAVLAIGLFALSGVASAPICDRACLLEQAAQFNANMLAHTTQQIPLAPNAQIRENTKAITLTESKWSTVKSVRSQGVYADAIKGNVIEHVAAETAAGKTVYIGTRLKVVDGKIKEVEINFDDHPNVNAKNLVPYDPIFNTILPPEDRATR